MNGARRSPSSPAPAMKSFSIPVNFSTASSRLGFFSLACRQSSNFQTVAQPVERDFAFVVDRSVNAADVLRAAQSADRKLITNVAVFDVYEGAGIEPGKKSIAVAVTLQPREKTMTDAEIDAVAAKIVAEVAKRTGGVLRA
jgi:phenylalanyl-tRNA synthetase beta subunit